MDNSTRLRTGPGTNWRILATLDVGTAVQLDGRDGTNNFWVRGITPDGTVGWMASAGLAVTNAELNTLPIKVPGDPFTLAAPAASAPAASVDTAASTDTTASVVVPAAAPAASLAPMGGFQYGGHVDAFDSVAVGWMQRAGMTWAKKQIRYNDGMSADSVAWVISDAQSKGFRILLGVVGFPGEINNAGYDERYADFVRGLAAAGADAIEVWNEPNIDREWPSGQISPARYTQLLAAAYNGIKAGNPSTMVVSGAPAPTGFFGGCSGAGCDDINFIAGMRDAGAASFMDCVGVHYNEGIVPPTARSGDPRGNSGYYTRYFQPMIETYSSAFGGRIPLCFTEMGYLTPEGFGPLPGGFAWAGNVTVAQQAAWLDSAMSIARASGDVRLVIIWNVDYKAYGADPVGGYAIIRPDLSCPACDALGN
ncbi:MAG: SH3 domain-containing protein [Chloroflexota bacterium]